MHLGDIFPLIMSHQIKANHDIMQYQSTLHKSNLIIHDQDW